MAAALGQFRDDGLGRPRSFQVARVIRKTDHAIGVADVDPLRVVADGIKRDPEGAIQTASECGNLLRLAIGAAAAENLDLLRTAIGHKEVAIGGHADLARLGKSFMGVQLYVEAGRSHRPHVVGLRHYLRKIRAGFRVIWFRKIGGGDLVEEPRLFFLIIGEGLLAGDQILGVDLIAPGASQNPTSAEDRESGGNERQLVHLASSDGHYSSRIAGGWWLVAGGWWLVSRGWWLVSRGWWLVSRVSCLVAGD